VFLNEISPFVFVLLFDFKFLGFLTGLFDKEPSRLLTFEILGTFEPHLLVFTLASAPGVSPSIVAISGELSRSLFRVTFGL
jgi:hypothetical protein